MLRQNRYFIETPYPEIAKRLKNDKVVRLALIYSMDEVVQPSDTRCPGDDVCWCRCLYVHHADPQCAAVAGLKEAGGTNTISSEDGEYHFSMEIDPNNVIDCDLQQPNSMRFVATASAVL